MKTLILLALTISAARAMAADPSLNFALDIWRREPTAIPAGRLEADVSERETQYTLQVVNTSDPGDFMPRTETAQVILASAAAIGIAAALWNRFARP